MANTFDEYFGSPHTSVIINTKLLLLCKGVDIDFESLKQNIPDLKDRYKTSKSVVSFRHLQNPGEYSDYMVDEILLSDSSITSIVKTYFTPIAPVALYAKAEGVYLYDKVANRDIPIDVQLVPLDEFSRHDDKFPDKNVFLNRIGIDRIGLLPFVGCELWLDGSQCHFCGSVPKPINKSNLPNLLEVRRKFGGDYKSWWDTHRDAALLNIRRSAQCLRKSPPSPHFHFMYMSENLSDYDYMYEIALEITSAFNAEIPLCEIDSFYNAMPPTSLEYLEKIKEAGYQSLVVNMEFITQEDFDRFCPGKACAYPDGYKHMMKTLRVATELFGHGKVRTNFVLTSEQMPALIEGIPNLADQGIVSDVTIFFPRKISQWSNKQSPSVDDVLSFSISLAEIYKEHEFKPYCCSLSSRSSILNELCQLSS
jgi:hypothetical protein